MEVKQRELCFGFQNMEETRLWEKLELDTMFPGLNIGKRGKEGGGQIEGMNTLPSSFLQCCHMYFLAVVERVISVGTIFLTVPHIIMLYDVATS